jgi:rRNA maturation RNase YbeY
VLVDIHFEDTEILDLDPEFFVSWLSRTCVNEGKELSDLNLVFCSDAYLLEMNKQHLDHDYYTDIITFDYSHDNSVSGDLFISIDRVIDNAKLFHVKQREELNRVVVHGVLHLIGYKDKSKEESKLMREKEDFYLGFT